MVDPIVMSYGYWISSPLSVARKSGGITLTTRKDKNLYIICNKEGITFFELSDVKSEYYVSGIKAIPSGEPADLVLAKWIPIMRLMGRDKFKTTVRLNTSFEEAKVMVGVKRYEAVLKDILRSIPYNWAQYVRG